MQSDPAQLIDLQFVEFDSFVETAESFNWRPVQLSKGQLNLRFRAVDVGDFGVFRLAFDPRVHDKSTAQPGLIAFSLVMSECNFGGVSVQRPSLGIILDTREYRSTFEPGFVCHEFYCKRELVEAHPIGGLILDPRRSQSELVFPLSKISAYRLRSIFTGLMEGRREFLGAFTRAATLCAVLNQIYRTISPDSTTLASRFARFQRSHLFDEALSLIENEERSLSVTDIARELGVSRRALEKSFNVSLGTTPGQFLLARKLTSVRDKLARGVGPVGEIASAEGFEHLSRFASQYRRLFDELPSDTLSRSSLLYQAA